MTDSVTNQLAACRKELAEAKKKGKRAPRKPTADNLAYKAWYAKNKGKYAGKVTQAMSDFWKERRAAKAAKK